MKRRQFQRAIETSRTCSAIKSTRRIFFNHLYESIEERGHFHVDQTFGSGSGTLIRKNGVFYLLTARHVLQNTTNFEFSNESPFWITALSKYQVNSIYDFLMPARILYIGDLIAGRGQNIDTSDLILVELFHPFPKHQPDHYLDFDNKASPLLSREHFFHGQILLAAGYPFQRNSFSFPESPRPGYTHETTVQRHITDGLCMFERGEPFMTLPQGVSESYEDLSGASGGLICNVQIKANQVRALGVLLSGGNRIIRFLPSYLIQEAIDRLHEAKSSVVDPAFTREPDFDKVISVMAQYAKYMQGEN